MTHEELVEEVTKYVLKMTVSNQMVYDTMNMEQKALFTQDITKACKEAITTTAQRVREENEVTAKLLKECEPFLSDHSGVGISDLVYRDPATVMRQTADRMEYEAELKRRVSQHLSTLNK